MSDSDLPPVYRDIPELKTMLLCNVQQTGRQLGVGSFGVVDELKYGGTICAGKKLHENLMDYRDEGVQQLIQRFVSECRLMSELRHPNIVQFLGLAFLKYHHHPILVMECLDISLDALLEEDHDLILTTRYQILSDVAKGLEYLHNREFPVIHRDLTTRNVLLNRTSMHAKIGDMGNALLVEQKKLSRTLSRNPGTTVYMPPEATGYAPEYDASLDMFSFGQLSLYTIIQEFPGDLLPATYCDPETEVITGRSELERRKYYIDILDSLLDPQHPFNETIKRCLSNLPSKRPKASQIIDIINHILSDLGDTLSTQDSSCISVDKTEDHDIVCSSADYIISEELMQSIKNGEIQFLHMRALNESSTVDQDDHNIVWRPCFLQLHLPSNCLKYSFDSKMSDDVQSINFSEIINTASICTAESDSHFYFFIYYNGTGSPLQLCATSSVERSCWIKALSFHLFDNDSYTIAQQSVGIAPTDHDRHNSSNSKEPVSIDCLHKPHYQPLDPFTRHNAIINVDDVTLEDKLTFRQLAMTHPNEMQLILLVKMQRMLCELQKEIHSQQSVKEVQDVMEQASPNSCSTFPETSVLKPDLNMDQCNSVLEEATPNLITNSQSYINAPEKESIVYSDLSFAVDYETPNPSEEIESTTAASKEMKLVLGDLLLNTNKVTDKMLVVEDSETYYPRPPWAKAETKPGTDLDSLHQEVLFLEETSVTNFEPIGEGQFGVVHKANLERDYGNIPVAVKTIKKYTEPQEVENFLREQAVMAEMVHPNVVRLYGLIKRASQSPWLILEYLPNGNLCQFLAINPRPVDTLIKYMLDIAVGMHYISGKGLIHRDLAARNVMVGKNEICKVGDFGLLREIPKDSSIYVSTSANTLFPVRWMAPESLEDREFSPASDVWSFGIVLWELVNPGAKPYGEKFTEFECGMRIMGGHKIEIPTVYSSTVQKIMKACWHKEPSKRPSFLLISSLLTRLTFGSNND